ncbi:MAG: class I SAM-dependent methyltransferase family protein [Candidatus Thorarchaeota archaeon]
MTSDIPYICVSTKDGESTRQRLMDLGLLNPDYRILSEDNQLFFPLKGDIEVVKLMPELDTIDFSTGVREFPQSHIGPKSLREALESNLNEEQLELLPRAYDLIGDIAVLEIPDEISEYRTKIADAFLEIHPNFTTVLGKMGAISGTLRTREYELLAGVDKTATIHTEYGCRISVDISKAYFSPRLLEEHNRVAKQVVEGETVVDMFTGVGPFALHIARRINAKVIAVDINPTAIDLLKQSIKMNKLQGSITPIVSHIQEYASTAPAGSIDRVIMNHPSGACDFIHTACHLLRKDGTMHYYDFMGGEDPEQSLSGKLSLLVKEAGRTVSEILLIRRVRDSAPYEYHMVIDAIIH